MLTDFCIVQGEDDCDGGVAIGCYDGEQRVLAVIDRKDLDDCFEWPPPVHRNPSITEKRRVVGENLMKLKPLIKDKYERGEYESYTSLGTPMRRVKIDLPSMCNYLVR